MMKKINKKFKGIFIKYIFRMLPKNLNFPSDIQYINMNISY